MYRQIIDGKIKCKDCGDLYPKDGKRCPGSYCPGCKRKRAKKDSAKSRYGLSPQEFTKLSDKYPVCAICGLSQTFIDHNHSTGKVRGRLCRNCNTGLGMFMENKKLLHSAINYLTSFENPAIFKL